MVKLAQSRLETEEML